MKNMMIRTLLLSLALSCLSAGLSAQTVKTISVSNDASYTDHVSLGEDARDKDVMIKFVFDEQQNTLTVSLLSYRGLFVFREPARYASVVRCGRLHPDKLPYLADAEPTSRFRLSRSLKRSLTPPLRTYVFNRWIEYDGLQPVPTDYKMVNDFIEQSFDILQKRTNVSVTLRDLFLLEPRPNKADAYELLEGRDLNTRYQIEIRRNPCLGFEEEIETAATMLGEIRSAFGSFRKTYGSGEVPSPEALKQFEQTRTLLLTQFPVRKNETECQTLRDLTTQYNQVVDSIATATCVVRLPADPALDGAKGLDVKMIYSQARQLDKAVARWLVSNDNLERRDLEGQCMDIINDMNALLSRQRAQTGEEQQAVKVFRQAEQYFKRTCGR